MAISFIYFFNIVEFISIFLSLTHTHTQVLFTDDCALVAHIEQDLQWMLDCSSKASKLFGLTISLGKMEVLHQPAPYSYPLSPPSPLMTNHLPT